MKKLIHILFDTAWGPATAWGVTLAFLWTALGLSHLPRPWGDCGAMLCYFSVLPLLLCVLLLAVAVLRGLWQRRWRRAVAQVGLFFAAFATMVLLPTGCCCILGGSFLSDPKPWQEPDYDNHALPDFQVGDRFKALSPLVFTTYSWGTTIHPALPVEEQALKDLPPGGTRINGNHGEERLLPVGTEIEIMAIKMNSFYKDAHVYFQVDGVGSWVFGSLFEHYTSGASPQLLYDREHFEKISPASAP